MSKPDPARQKSLLRLEARALRRDIPDSERTLLDQRIRQHLVRAVRHENVQRLAAFLPFDGEPDLAPALAGLADEGRTIALPFIDPAHAGAMTMRTWKPDCVLRINAFGIPEPTDGAEQGVDTFDLVFLPLVAYDAEGTRLGMGSGYYDRWLRGRKPGHRLSRVGVAYARQQWPALPREAWDVPLDAIVNERGWFPFPL